MRRNPRRRCPARALPLARWLRVALVLLGVAAGPGPAAADGGRLVLARLAGDGWEAAGVTLEWRWQGADGVALDLAVETLRLAAIDAPFRELSVTCRTTLAGLAERACKGARFRVVAPRVGEVRGRADARFPAAAAPTLHLEQVAACGGTLALRVANGPPRWRLTGHGEGFAAGCVAALLGDALPWPALDAAGEVGLTVELDGLPGAFEGRVQVAGRGLDLASGDAAFASERLDLALDARIARRAARWEVDGRLALADGALYVEPLLVDAGRAPLTVELAGRLDGDAIEITRLSAHQGDATRLDGRLSFDAAAFPRPRSAELSLASDALPGLYRDYLQPFLIGTPLDELEPTGRVRADLRGGAQGWAVTLRLADVDLLDGRGRFAFSGLAGELAWDSASAPPSRLGWTGGHLLRLALGPSELAFTAAGGRVELTSPWRLPLVDGALRVARLRVDGLGGETPAVALQAELEPVTLAALSELFDWPAMSGRIAGSIPSLTYAEGRLDVGGDLVVHAFGGELRIAGLTLRRPLGPLPALEADITLRELELEQVTRTFTIGRIEGRLGGYVRDLELQDWRPVRFDARLATPPGDASRHRISQRAIDSLSSLGGLGGALSRSFLRFFDDFGYDRLGLTCRLRGNVCELGGVEPADDGYYLVKGGGLPRIDVIGHQRRVDWPDLVARLRRAMESPAPVIQ